MNELYDRKEEAQKKANEEAKKEMQQNQAIRKMQGKTRSVSRSPKRYRFR